MLLLILLARNHINKNGKSYATMNLPLFYVKNLSKNHPPKEQMNNYLTSVEKPTKGSAPKTKTLVSERRT